MRTIGAVASGLHAAVLLARGRAEGLLLVEADMRGAARSFWAMAVCLPAILCVRLMGWIGAALPPRAGVVLGRDLLLFGVGWLAYALLSHRVATVLGRPRLWPRFIAAWNWCNVIENLLVVAGSIPGLLGAPPVADQVAQVVTMGWALWLEWFVTRLALGVTGLTAAWLVLVDVSIGLILAAVGASLGG